MVCSGAYRGSRPVPNSIQGLVGAAKCINVKVKLAAATESRAARFRIARACGPLVRNDETFFLRHPGQARSLSSPRTSEARSGVSWVLLNRAGLRPACPERRNFFFSSPRTSVRRTRDPGACPELDSGPVPDAMRDIRFLQRALRGSGSREPCGSLSGTTGFIHRPTSFVTPDEPAFSRHPGRALEGRDSGSRRCCLRNVPGCLLHVRKFRGPTLFRHPEQASLSFVTPDERSEIRGLVSAAKCINVKVKLAAAIESRVAGFRIARACGPLVRNDETFFLRHPGQARSLSSPRTSEARSGVSWVPLTA